MAWGRGERPAPLRGAGPRLRKRGGAASLCQWRHRHPDAGTGPNTGSPDGGAYARRYREREHVNESGHGGLPAGVVPGPGTNRT